MWLATVSEGFRVLMIAGGTGGHIFPMLAVAEELRRRADARGDMGCTVEFLGTCHGLESRLIPAAGFPLHTVAAAGLKGIRGWKRWANLTLLPRSVVETALVLSKVQPDVVAGIGSYLAGPAMLEAALSELPTLLIEPNAVPGFTNRILAPVVRRAALGFEEGVRFYGSKACVTGHPVRKAFFHIKPKEHTPPFTVLVVGGSQGSKAVNECIIGMLPLLKGCCERLTIIHQTGERDFGTVERAYQDAGVAAEVHAFIEDMPGAFARADLIVSRAGATAVAELAAAGKAAVLIPFPAATDQHQLANAKVFERAGAARVIEQSDLTAVGLLETIQSLLCRPQQLRQMEQCARRLARPDAAARIAEMIWKLAGRGD